MIHSKSTREGFYVAVVASSVTPQRDRPIVPCPPSMREEVRRALLGKLSDLETEIDNCRRRALEGGFALTAERIDRLRAKVGPIAEGLRKEVVE